MNHDKYIYSSITITNILRRIPVVIASLLKPVDDSRMYEKLGLSLAQTNKYEINIIGFSIKKNKFYPNIHPWPLFSMRRLSIRRFFLPLKYLKLLLKVKPKIIIVNSIDLLFVTILYSIITGSTFIYDVQENYLRNIIHNSLLPVPVNFLAAGMARSIEYAAHPFIHHYLVAEEAYFDEMPYLNGKGILIRNLYNDLVPHPAKRIFHPDRIRILYSGTIARVYGIFRIMDFITRFHEKYQEIELFIAGYCPHSGTMKKIRKYISDKPFIHLAGGETILPHSEIISCIRDADFGIIDYDQNPAIAGCFPTRIYEYMGNYLPMLIQEHPVWSVFCLRHDAGIPVNFTEADYDELIKKMKEKEFYSGGIPKSIYWKPEEYKLLDLFSEISARLD